MDGQIPSGFSQSEYLGMDGLADSSENTDEVEEDNSPLPVRTFLRTLGGTYRNYRSESFNFNGFRKYEASEVMNDLVSRYRKHHLVSLMEILNILNDSDFDEDEFLRQREMLTFGRKVAQLINSKL